MTDDVAYRYPVCTDAQEQVVRAGDIIVHVFRPEVRQFYNLEKMWGADRPSERLVG